MLIAKKSLRQLKARAIRFEKKQRPIAVFGLRRGGSTMVADAITACRGVWFANEPYAVLPAHPAYSLRKQLLPPAEHSHFFRLRGADLEKFRAYTQGLLIADFWQIGTCPKTKLVMRADRVCLKILNAPWMLEWFLENTDANVITVIRHPAAQALSVIRQGWRFPVEAYAKRASEFEGYFTLPQLEILRSALTEEDVWKVAIIDWVVTTHPLRLMGDERVMRLKYENIVADPEAFTDNTLVGALGLSDRAAMLERFSRPSNSSMMSIADTNTAILQRDLDKIVNSWRAKLDDRMKRDGQQILDAFEVSDYRFVD